MTAVTQTAGAQTPTTGTLEICKSAANGMSQYGPFVFDVSGYGTVTVQVATGAANFCSAPLAVPSGQHTITEVVGPSTNLPSYDKVTAIKVSPTFRVVTGTKNLTTRSVTVRVPPGSTQSNETLVTYTNKIPPGSMKICKVSSDPNLQGQYFSFHVNGGPAISIKAGSTSSPNCGGLRYFPIGTKVSLAEDATTNVHVASITEAGNGTLSNVSMSAGTATLTIGAGMNVVTYDNEPNAVPQLGWIEVCKNANDPYVTGQFEFTITAPGFSKTVSEAPSECSSPIQVPAGNVTVTEASRAPYTLHSVWTYPSGRKVSVNRVNGTAVVSVPVSASSSNETQVHFVNQTTMGQLKVCKAITATSGALAGQTFPIGISLNFASTTGATGGTTVQVTAGTSAGTTNCTIFGNLPLGTQVTVNEASPGTAGNGAAYQAVSGNGSTVTIGPGVNTATVTNQAMGTIKVCKTILGFTPTTVPSFPFTVTDGGTTINVSVQPGKCSDVLTVPAGTATVTETQQPGYHLTSVGGASSVDISSNSATFQVPATGPEAVATFYNAVNSAQFEICKLADANSGTTLNNITFNFSWSGSQGGSGTYTGTSGLQPGQCTQPVALPVLQANGTANQVTVTETGSSPTTQPWHLSSIAVTGSGSQVSQNLTTRSNTFTLGLDNGGVTTDTFTNSAG